MNNISIKQNNTLSLVESKCYLLFKNTLSHYENTFEEPNKNFVFSIIQIDDFNTKIIGKTSSYNSDDIFLDINCHIEHIPLFLNTFKNIYKKISKIEIKFILHQFFLSFFIEYFNTFALSAISSNFDDLLDDHKLSEARCNYFNLPRKERYQIFDLMTVFSSVFSHYFSSYFQKNINHPLIFFYFSTFIYLDNNCEFKIPEITKPSELFNSSLYKNVSLYSFSTSENITVIKYTAKVIKEVFQNSSFSKYFSTDEINELVFLCLYKNINLSQEAILERGIIPDTLSFLNIDKTFDFYSSIDRNQLFKDSYIIQNNSCSIDFSKNNLFFDKFELLSIRRNLCELYVRIQFFYKKSNFDFLDITTNLDINELSSIKKHIEHMPLHTELYKSKILEIYLLSNITLSINHKYKNNLSAEQSELIDKVFIKFNRGVFKDIYFDLENFSSNLREISIILKLKSKINDSKSRNKI